MDFATLEVFLFFMRMGLLAWGGGQVVLGEMQRESVAHGWLTEVQFLEALAIGQMTPGPGSTFVIPIGYQAAGVPGALAAAIGFFLPTVSIGLALISMWNHVRGSRWPVAIREAVMPVVLGLVLASVYTIGRTALTDATSMLIAGSASLVFLRTSVPPVLLILAAVALGAIFFQ
jgi:chromate transporter